MACSSAVSVECPSRYADCSREKFGDDKAVSPFAVKKLKYNSCIRLVQEFRYFAPK